MAKTQIFVNELGDDKLDGLNYETPVRSDVRAKEVAGTIENPSYSIEGSDAYVRRISDELGIGGVHVR